MKQISSFWMQKAILMTYVVKSLIIMTKMSENLTFYKLINDTYEGEMSHPCCIKAPSAYQRLLEIVKSLVMFVLSTFHSAGLNLLTRNNTTLTPT